MIKSFADSSTEELFATGSAARIPSDIAKRVVRKLEYLDLATRVSDLATPPGNRLHRLKADRAGRYAISVNDQWRICFRFEDGDAYDVELVDYH